MNFISYQHYNTKLEEFQQIDCHVSSYINNQKELTKPIKRFCLNKLKYSFPNLKECLNVSSQDKLTKLQETEGT